MRKPAGHHYLVGLVGAGVTASLTPPMHMREAAAQSIPYLYRPIDLTVTDLTAEEIGEILRFARALGYDALNITHPCKQLVLPHLDRVDPVAARLGAVNTVVFDDDGAAVGHNTDISGFASAVTTGLPDADLGRVVQLGAGGAGAAVSAALLELGVQHLTVVDVDSARSAGLAGELADRYPTATVDHGHPDDLTSLVAEADGLVHCTPTGMADHPGLPLDAGLLHPGLWVADIVYRPLDTALLQAARAAGCRTLHGGHMAVYQAVDAFRLITGVNADADRMLAHLRELTASEH